MIDVKLVFVGNKNNPGQQLSSAPAVDLVYKPGTGKVKSKFFVRTQNNENEDFSFSRTKDP